MGKRCEICGKIPHFGHNISHAHNVTTRRWLPNLQKVKIILNGSPRRVYVCARCLKSQRVFKAM